MTLEHSFDDTLKQAIKHKDGRTADVVRMLKTRLQERRTAKGFEGVVDDALVLEVIGAYRKQLQKAIAEYDKIGQRGADQAAQLRFELEFCRGRRREAHRRGAPEGLRFAQAVSGAPASFSRTDTGAVSGATSASRRTMSVCSSACWPAERR